VILPGNPIPSALRDPKALSAAAENAVLPDSIASLLRSACVERPDQVALRLIEGGSYTYAELADAVSTAANALSELGVDKNHRLAILLPNMAEYPIIYLAAATLGVCVVPINTSYTAAEIEYVLRDSGATFAIVEETLRSALEAASAVVANLPAEHIVVVGGDLESRSWGRRYNAATNTRAESACLDSLMTIQYTSGTTGFPKGALLTQRYWLTVGLAQSVELAHLDARNILVVYSFFYMDPFWQLMVSLMLRGTIVLAPRMSAANFMTWVRTFNIHYALVTSLIYKQPPSELDGVHELRLLQTYGFSKEIHANFEARFMVPVREVYGMTEIGAGTFLPLAATDMVGSGSVGIAAPFRRLKIVDEMGAEVARGGVGELWVSGRGLFSGYNNLPEVSAEALAGGWMRTGDLFRQDELGYYYLVGRLKDMVRRNMENVSTHEVEQVLIGHPGIAQAAVLAVPDAQKGEEVLALVVLRDDAIPALVSPEVIRDYCATRLAKFKVPRYVGYRSALPMTPSAKVAKGQLRKETPDLKVGCFDSATLEWVKSAE
jgi:acyl-CoA synthetase (AMP-forming)/AMP-acid ligase II